MKSSAKKIELASVDDLFSTEEGRQDAKLEKIQEIPLSELHPFRNHPFKVKDDEAMMETADSIKQYGVLVPAIARPDPEGGYELVAGHRRHRASELAEKETMPVIVRDLDDDAATIIMVDSNLQRESLLPSERAFAYKMKLDAMKHQGERVDLTCSQVGNKLEGKKSSEILAEQVGQSKNQIFRYIRLTELIPELLDMVDEKKIALNPAYELSFLKKEEQRDLLDAMDSEQATPSLSQAQRLKKYSQEGHLTLDMMRVIMGEEKKSDLDRVTFTLEDNKLMIEETEAVAIRKIFELYTSSEIGLGGIANQLNLQGIRKIPRQNGTLEDWTGHFIKLILDNPVYCGKIAYGRRTKEKVKGTKNDYQMKRNDDYILTEGQHKGIVSEEVWEKAHAKRLRTGVKQPSKIGRDRVHLLSGLLKCPVCGSPMYTNKHAWTNKDGTYKEIYYYVCSRNRMVRGKHCEYKAMLKKTDIEPMVIEAIREIVRNEEYAQAIKKRIGVQIDTKAVDKELEGYQAKLKEVDLNKTRLEREIDSLSADAKYRERKLHDMTLRLDSLYDVIVELEEKIEDARLRRDAIKQQAITLENIYKIMVNFDCVYNIINDEEKRNVVTALIKEIEIYRNDESEYPLKRIGLNFPVFKDGGEVMELLWDKGNTVESCLLLLNVLIGVAFGLVVNKPAHTIPESNHAADAVLRRNGKLHGIHATVFPEVHLPVHDSVAEIPHIGISGDGIIFFLQFPMLVLGDLCMKILDGSLQKLR